MERDIIRSLTRRKHVAVSSDYWRSHAVPEGKTLLDSYSFWVCCPLDTTDAKDDCNIINKKDAACEDRTHDLQIMRLTRCRLRQCRCLPLIPSPNS